MYITGNLFRNAFAGLADDIFFSEFGKPFESVEKSKKIALKFIEKHGISDFTPSELCRGLVSPVIGEPTLPEHLRKQFSTELKRNWQQQNPSLSEVRDKFYLEKTKSESEVFEELTKCVQNIAGQMRWKILEYELGANAQYGLSLGTSQDNGFAQEKMYLLNGKIWEYLDINCNIELRSKAGDVSISTSYLLLVPRWKINYLSNGSYSSDVSRVVRENLVLLARLNDVLSL